MCPDATAVDDGPRLVHPHAKRFEDARKVTMFGPIVEAIVNTLPRPESLGQITPWNARLSTVENGLNEESIANFRLRPVTLLRKDASQSFPLLVAQSVSVHPDF